MGETIIGSFEGEVAGGRVRCGRTGSPGPCARGGEGTFAAKRLIRRAPRTTSAEGLRVEAAAVTPESDGVTVTEPGARVQGMAMVARAL